MGKVGDEGAEGVVMVLQRQVRRIAADAAGQDREE
jgi:hypothetical protein